MKNAGSILRRRSEFHLNVSRNILQSPYPVRSSIAGAMPLGFQRV